MSKSFAIYCPLTTLGSTSKAAATYDSYSNRVEDVTLDCNGIAGCIGGQNWYSVEKSGYFNVTFVGYTNIGLDIEGSQAQDSGPYEHLLFNPATGCTANTLDLVVRGSVPRLITDFSASNGHKCGSVLQSVAFEIDSPVTGVRDGHFENKAIGIGIGDNPTCPMVCPAPISSGTVSAVSIDRIDMSCSNCTALTGLTAEIINLGTNAPIEDIYIHAVGQSVGVNTLITTLDDHKNSCAVSDSSLAEYIIGHTGLIESSSASSCHQLATGTITDTSGNAPIIIAANSSSNGDQITVTNAANGSGGPVSIAAAGADTNISLALTPKGTGLISANGSIASVSSITMNNSSNLCGTSSSPCLAGTEGATGPTPTASDDFIFFSSANHCAEESYNAGALECIPGINGSVTATHVAIFNSAIDIKDAGFAYNAIPLNDIVSPAGPVATFADGNNPVVFSSHQTTGSQSAMTFSEASAASGTGDIEVAVSTMNGSTAIPLNIFQGTLTGALTQPALNISSTWNTSGTVDALIKANVTNTGSGSLSALLDLQVGGNTQFAITGKGTSSAVRYAVDSSGTLLPGDFALSAGWGTGASVAITNTNSKDQAFTVTVTAGSSGLVTSPTLTLTFHNGGWGNVPVYICKMEGGSGTTTSLKENPTNAALPITLLTVPASGATYVISCIGMGT